MSEHTGHTGGVEVGILIVLLSLYSLHRIWGVWAYTLNFDGTQSNKGWDFLVQWVMDMVRLRRGRRRRKKRKQQMEELGQWYTTKEPNHLNIHNNDQDDDEVVNGVVNML